MLRHLSLVFTTSLAAAACGSGDTGRAWQSSLDTLVATELAFARLATDSTVQHAFVTYIAPDGILFRPGPVDGQDWLERNPMPAELRLEWQPEWADLAADGSLGYTTGPWLAGLRGDTTPAAAGGRFVTLWRRTPAGYRAVLDFGTGGEAPISPPPLQHASPPSVPSGSTDATAGRESVRLADEDLGVALSADGRVAWTAYADPSVRWLRDGTVPARGVDAAPDDGRGRAFRTLGADVAESGDLGYSWGEWQPEGEERTAPAGYYLRIWRRQADGSWRVVLDLFGRSG